RGNQGAHKTAQRFLMLHVESQETIVFFVAFVVHPKKHSGISEICRNSYEMTFEFILCLSIGGFADGAGF
ncbi:MAG: hypothetical protein WCO71_12705, partial [Pseudomonadota bacterium]